jgi:hypothetical protein
MMRRILSPLAALVLLATAVTGLADEGMWLFNAPPTKQLKEKYQFEPDAKWLEHIQKSSVRFPHGSGSFVSPHGLVMTNHHVGLDSIHQVSNDKKNYVKDGFHAKSQSEEIKIPDLELNVLQEITNVTDKVNAAVKPGMSAAEAQKARRAVINTLTKDATDEKNGIRGEVVTLFQGAQYHLYKYKKYNDVRLVFAPEVDIAFFGGDPDNFEYPRYDLDISFFRVYENDKPLKTEHYLTWSEAGCKDGELIFVSGNPGRTNRLNTVKHLEFFRDLDYPFRLNLIRRREVNLRAFSDRNLENARRARDELFSYQNSRKARLGGLAGLQDPALMGRKKKAETELRAAIEKDSKLREEYGDAWSIVEKALEAYRPIYNDVYLYERGAGFDSQLFGFARSIVRMAEESTKPNVERLPEYSEARIPTLKEQLAADTPIYENLEIVKLADSLSLLTETLGATDEMVQKVLAGKGPRDRAVELINGTKLRDAAERKKLASADRAAIEGSSDTMIQLAKLVDPISRKMRKVYEEKVDEPQKQAYKKIANAIFDIKKGETYPDATFTPRLAFGEVKGYEENGKKIPWATNIGDTFKHAEAHGSQDPFLLPKSWTAARSKLTPDVPFNFVSTADIIGGNSGSPVINRKGELVGIIFDGNIESLVLDFEFEDKVARAVAVHSAGIIEALKKVYNAEKLVAELTAKP